MIELTPDRIEKQPIGGLWDDIEWELHFGVWACSFGSSDPVCPHAVESKPEAVRSDLIWWYHKIPKVIVAYSEGGCVTTGLCADCVAARLNVEDK